MNRLPLLFEAKFKLFALAFCMLMAGARADTRTFGVRDATSGGKYCILFQADISGTVHYTDKTGHDRSSDFSVPLEVPTKTMESPNSHCGNRTQQLAIEFVPDGIAHNETEADHFWWLALQFNATDAKDHYNLVDYSLNVEFFEKQNASVRTYNYTVAPTKGAKLEWGATVNQPDNKPNAFACSKGDLQFGNGTSVIFKNLKVVAFARELKASFPKDMITEPCTLDMRTSDLIPIIVGACLAGLVIIVLIAYLIGRARAKRQGYASV